jgi:hypothetical protein
MDNLGIQKVNSQEQYIIYYIYFSKFIDSMPCKNTMKPFYLPTLDMAQNVYITLQYFIHNWDRGFDGGELETGLRRCDQVILGNIPKETIRKSLFTKINNNLLMDSQGITINIPNFIEMSTELMKYKCNLRLQNKGVPFKLASPRHSSSLHSQTLEKKYMKCEQSERHVVAEGGILKGFYDEYMLAVLRHTDFLPRIKRTTFTLNPFSYNYIETDEKTVRKMGLVIKN